MLEDHRALNNTRVLIRIRTSSDDLDHRPAIGPDSMTERH